MKSDPGKSILLVKTQGQTHVRLTMELIFRDKRFAKIIKCLIRYPVLFLIWFFHPHFYLTDLGEEKHIASALLAVA